MNETEVRTWPHLSELQGLLVVFERLGIEWVVGHKDQQVERITARVHVLDGTALVNGVPFPAPAEVGTMWITAPGLVSAIKYVGRRFVSGRPYRYELRRGPRSWGLTTPTAHEFRMVDRYVEGLR